MEKKVYICTNTAHIVELLPKKRRKSKKKITLFRESLLDGLMAIAGRGYIRDVNRKMRPDVDILFLEIIHFAIVRSVENVIRDIECRRLLICLYTRTGTNWYFRLENVTKP